MNAFLPVKLRRRQTNRSLSLPGKRQVIVHLGNSGYHDYAATRDKCGRTGCEENVSDRLMNRGRFIGSQPGDDIGDVDEHRKDSNRQVSVLNRHSVERDVVNVVVAVRVGASGKRHHCGIGTDRTVSVAAHDEKVFVAPD